MIPTLIMIAVLAFAIALLFLFPSREVTQLPGRWQSLWETAAPGASPSWSFFGGVALLAWIYLLLQDLFLFWKGSPYLIAMNILPNPSAYGVPSPEPLFDVLQLINPSWAWVYLAPAVLCVVNLALVFRDKLFRKTM